MLEELLTRTEQFGQSNRLREEGITEKAIIRLAQRIAGDTDDLGQAWLELKNAMDIALRVQQEGRVNSNHGDFVDAVLERTADLAAEGEYGNAAAAIATALAEEDAAHQARKTRLLESGIEIAMLDGESGTAADLLVQKADLDKGGTSTFGELRKLHDQYYENGHYKGTTLDLRIAVALTRQAQSRAANADERGYAQNILGNALATLGERESGTDRLREAVATYENSLKVRTRERVPLDWAMTQNNLGNALQILGERVSGNKLLLEAVSAFENALKELTREQVPLNWAMTQNNLGNALQTLGERESGTKFLSEAVTAYENALKEWTRERVPLDWAMTQMNLGTALRTLGERESGTKRLLQAITAYENALGEYVRDRVPLRWAVTQMNLGTALRTLGERESGTKRLHQAVTAYDNALKERTRERVPLDWAITQNNLAVLELAFFDKTTESVHLDQAMAHAIAAREVFGEAGASQYLSMNDRTIAIVNARRGQSGDA